MCAETLVHDNRWEFSKQGQTGSGEGEKKATRLTTALVPDDRRWLGHKPVSPLKARAVAEAQPSCMGQNPGECFWPSEKETWTALTATVSILPCHLQGATADRLHSNASEGHRRVPG